MTTLTKIRESELPVHPKGEQYCCSERCGRLLTVGQPYYRIVSDETNLFVTCDNKQCAEEVIRSESPNMCLTPFCSVPLNGTESRRGLCLSCYNKASQLVRDGKTTWETLIAEGKALESTRKKPKFRL